ncbi:5'/3'-nucleotidase SurE [Cyanobacterium aponinum UTEX 3222]|uniref:5'/3'-nucleotidase SurE n=1 Tax=Cyanobacterium aponinum TaxID=379064 RepID=UPI00308B42E0|nr:5'/3'-nucleotidase SurE [Cyanobacterium aponinum UTEX 3222]
MRILISNDDGIFAKGIRTLANAIASCGHEVIVVAPDRERSATGHGLTLHQPIRADIIEGIFHTKVTAWSCSGTPSDCVKLALSAILKDTPPDFVLSGINEGPNLGTDVLYSGTVSAAMEGTMEGITSIAFSLASFTIKEFQPAANYALKLIKQLIENPLPEATLLNVNIPPVSEPEIKGVKITRQGIRRYTENFKQRFDPRGKSYYWLAGEVVEEIEQPEHIYLPPDLPTDVQANKDNYITITPLQYNLTDVVTVQRLEQKLIIDN